jgi:2-(1,2-epoxy-1,2-dihydrophenyl)acetyl-CoA isomerase
LIAGQGRAFCAGFDLKQGDVDAGAQIAAMQELTRVLRRSKLPSVAVLHGHAVGGGLELALACDLVVAAPEAKLIFPDVGHSFAVGGGATYLLPRMIGLARTRRLLFLGEPMTGAEAYETGLVAGLADDALAEGRALADKLAATPPGGLTMIRGAIEAGLESTLDAALDQERDDCIASFYSAEGRASVTAFSR